MTTISINAIGIGLENFHDENEESLFYLPKMMQILRIGEDEFIPDSFTWRDLLLEYTLDDMIAAAIERYDDTHPAIKYIESFNGIDGEYIAYRIKPQWKMTEEEKSFTEDDIKEAIYLSLFPCLNWNKNFILKEIDYLTIIDEI